jgi:uncharacterized RDD family membrane protein YckC
MARDGQLQPHDVVWCDGMIGWAPARTVPGLFPDAAMNALFAPTLGQAGPALADEERTLAQAGSALADEERTLAQAGPELMDAAPTLAYDSRAFSPGHFAGFWIRLLALLIDIAAYFAIVMLVLMLPLLYAVMRGCDFWTIVQLVNGTELVVFVLYFTLFESSAMQGTLGKRTLGLKVIKYDGSRLTRRRALLRTVARPLGAILLGIGYIMAAFMPRKEALHDLIAGTQVVHCEMR